MQCEQQPWAPRLLAISCLSLAAKMQRVAAFSIAYIQVLDSGACACDLVSDCSGD